MPSESMNRILINHKNLSEVLSVYGLLILAECLDTAVARCRFASTRAVLGDDDVFRAMAFEFEHPDYETLLQRIAALDVLRLNGKVALIEQGTAVMGIDWVDMGSFIGDAGNFSKADKLAFVKLHHEVFKELTSTSEDLFSFSVERNETNFLSNMSSMKKNYIDAGGVYDSADNEFFARELLLLVALQNLRSVMTRLVLDKSLDYTLVTTWTNPAGMFGALTADVPMNKSIRMEARTSEFGNYGLVLKTAKEVTQMPG